MTEDDTARRLRRIPYKDFQAIFNVQFAGIKTLTEDDFKIIYTDYGWTRDELIGALLDDLGRQLEDLKGFG